MRSSPKIDPPASGARPVAKIAAGLDATYRPDDGRSRGSFFVGGALVADLAADRAASSAAGGTTLTWAASVIGPAKNSGASRLWFERTPLAPESLGARTGAVAEAPLTRLGPSPAGGVGVGWNVSRGVELPPARETGAGSSGSST